MSRDALVVGINTYQHLPGLKAPAHDAEAIAQVLQTYGDFRVTRLPEVVVNNPNTGSAQTKVGVKTPVTLRELEAALIRLFKPKGKNIPHTALFYFSGHGLQKDAGIQEGYLAVNDSYPEVGFYGLSLFWLRRLLQESPVRQRIIWLDCCHSGELLNILEADPGARPGTDRLFMAASREYEPAYEGLEGSYSVFTEALLTGLDPKLNETGIITNYALTNSVSNALKAEIQQPLFENSGSEIILTRCTRPPAAAVPVRSPSICPYRGLHYFDESHAEYFFGREDLTDQLIDKLRTGRFVAVVGASGSGKSSLVRAGLMHELRRGTKFSGSDRWQLKLITPTERPLRSLANAFIDPQATGLERAEQLRRAEAFLKDGGSGLAQLAQASAIAHQRELAAAGNAIANPHLVLVIDQFEEVFTLCQGAQAEQERYRFFNCLVGALQEAGQHLSIVIALRADFFGKCSLYSNLAQQIEQHLVTVTPLTYEQIKATIVRPAQKVGLMCEPNLIYTMLLDVVGAPGELPLLQYTLLELWEHRQEGEQDEPTRLTLNAYTELGGVRGTLQKRATEIFCSLTAEEQRVAQRIFLALTQLGEGTEDTRRRILKSELISARFPASVVDRVLEKLVAAKLVVTNQVLANNPAEDDVAPVTVVHTQTHLSTALQLAANPQPVIPYWSSEASPALVPDSDSPLPQPTWAASDRSLYYETVDVAHEALIRNWPLLRTWLDESREMLRRQRRIEQATREWQRAGQPLDTEYLLRGSRLIDAEDFLSTYSDELSALAQQYIMVSQDENRKAQKESRVLQIAVPCALLVALGVSLNQYRTASLNQAEKDYQIQVATSRQQAAIAQTILQEPDGDPAAALLISRLAAEQGRPTLEAQASLRAALQKLQLQAELRGHQGSINRVMFSPNQNHLATAGTDGVIHLWSVPTQTVEKTFVWATSTNSTSPDSPSTAKPTPIPIVDLAFSPDGQQIAAIAKDARQVQIWSVASGARVLRLSGFTQAITQITYSPKGQWLATASTDNTIRIWQAETGKLQAQIVHQGPINSLAFSSNGQWLLTASTDGTAQLWQTATGRSQYILRHTGAVNQATFSPSSQWIATACDDGKARLWNAQTGRLIHTFTHVPASPNRLVVTPQRSFLSPNGIASSSTVASPTSVGATTQRDRPLEMALPSSRNTLPILQVIFSPDEQWVATADPSHQVWLWSRQSGQLAKQLATEELPTAIRYAGPEPIAFSPNSQMILTTTRNQMSDRNVTYAAHLWSVSTGQEISVLRGHSSAITAAQFSLNGSYIATGSADGLVRLWSTEPSGELPTLAMPAGAVQWASFLQSKKPPTQTKSITTELTPSKRFLLSLPFKLRSQLSNAALLSQPSAKNTTGLNPQPNVTSGTQTQMVTVNALGQLQFWNLATPNPARQSLKLNAIQPPTTATPTHVQALQTVQLPSSSSATLTSTALSPNGQQIAIANTEGWIEWFRLKPNRPPQLISRWQNLRDDAQPSSKTTDDQFPVVVRQLKFSHDGKKLLGVSDDTTIRVWDLGSHQPSQILRGHTTTITQAQFSHNDQQIISASWDHTARIWDVASGRMVKLLQHQDMVLGAVLSPDNQLIVTANWDGTARIWDVATGTLRVILAGHRGSVMDAEFSPDGRSIVTASGDGTARLWDAETGTEQAQLRMPTLNNHVQSVRRAFFSPDGQYVVTVADDGKVRLWAATWSALLKLARDRTLRQLSPEECVRYLRLVPDQCPVLAAPNAAPTPPMDAIATQ